MSGADVSVAASDVGGFVLVQDNAAATSTKRTASAETRRLRREFGVRGTNIDERIVVSRIASTADFAIGHRTFRRYI